MGVELYFLKKESAQAADFKEAALNEAEEGAEPALDFYPSLKWATRTGRLGSGVGLTEDVIPPNQLVTGARAALRTLYAEVAGDDAELQALLLGGDKPEEHDDRMNVYASLPWSAQLIESADAWARAKEVVRKHEAEGDWTNLLLAMIKAGKEGCSAMWSY